MRGWRLEPVAFSAIPGWSIDNPADALTAFQRSHRSHLAKPYRTGAFGITYGDLAPVLDQAAELDSANPAQTRAFFEQHFTAFRVTPSDRERGFVTGYYEPVAKASPVRTEDFRYPVYAKPDDLLEVDETGNANGLPDGYRFGRRDGGRWSPYADRGEIERGYLAGRGLEIAWLKDRTDLFFIHIQGAARLVMPDGSESRITYAAKTGHPFTGIGKLLADMGEIPLEKVTMASIRNWLATHPDRHEEIFWQNRSFIFFRKAMVDDKTLGPVAAAKVPLTPGRSIAVDRLIHTFGTPFFIDAPNLKDEDGKPFQRLMIAQDTGSAIVGPARADIFFGSGKEAGSRAGMVKHDADFYILVPESAAGQIEQ